MIHLGQQLARDYCRLAAAERAKGERTRGPPYNRFRYPATAQARGGLPIRPVSCVARGPMGAPRCTPPWIGRPPDSDWWRAEFSRGPFRARAFAADSRPHADLWGAIGLRTPDERFVIGR